MSFVLLFWTPAQTTHTNKHPHPHPHPPTLARPHTRTHAHPYKLGVALALKVKTTLLVVAVTQVISVMIVACTAVYFGGGSDPEILVIDAYWNDKT